MERLYDFLYLALKKKKVLIVGLFNDTTTDICVLQVEELKGEILKESVIKFESVDLFTDWYMKQKEALPIVLTIASQSVPVQSGQADTNLFSPEEFLIESDPETHLFAFARRDQLKQHLIELDQLKHNIISIFLGPVKAYGWASKVSEQNVQIIGNYEITRLDEGVQIKEVSHESAEWNDRTFGPDELLLYLTSFEYFLSGINRGMSSIYEAAIEFTFRLLFRKLFVYGSVVLLAVFLGSAILFLYFDSTKTELEGRHQSNKILADAALKYEEDIESLESVLNITNRRPIISKYAVELGRELPQSILLIGMKVFPIEVSSSNRQNSLIKRNWIVINGETRSVADISKWVGDLKKYPWVLKILKQEIEKKEGKYIFNLRLEVPDVE
ncbi:MAG: hypothetical protein ABJF04_23110 [Reichenbachiella sp.]|uniref:hypothetical protein n=1 Tax=Reichenbachiella sp. TaxID=2184521 RepID=UPI003264238B